jgi:hypothetical protein
MDTATTATSVDPIMSNFVSGKIINKETGTPIANLQIDLFDLDNWPDPELSTAPVLASAASSSAGGLDVYTLYRTADRIGSMITDESGTIEFATIPKDFNLPGKKIEEKPDLALVVLVPNSEGG